MERPDDALAKAIDFLKPLQLFGGDRIETHLLAFEIYIRKNKPLLMIQAITRAYKIDERHPEVHNCIVRLIQSLPTLIKDLNETVKLVIESAIKKLIGNKSAKELNEQFLAENKNSIPHLYECARIMYELDTSKKNNALKLILSADMEKITLKVC